MKALPILLLVVAAVTACDGVKKVKTTKRLNLRSAEVGTVRDSVRGELAAIVLHADKEDVFFTSDDTRGPKEILAAFQRVLPIAANFKAHGASSCELEITISQSHWQTISDQRLDAEKRAWFRFQPNTDLAQHFWVTTMGSGRPETFTPVFAQQPLIIPLVIHENHYIETQEHPPRL